MKLFTIKIAIMKRIIPVICAVIISSAASTQTVHKTSMKEGVMKKNGKMWFIQILPDSMILDNGTVVYINGSLKSTDNKHYTLAEGDKIDFEGAIQAYDQKIDDERGMIVMNNHIMWVWSVLDKPLLLSHGKYAMPDGTIKLTTGKFVKLKNDSFVDKDGNAAAITW